MQYYSPKPDLDSFKPNWVLILKENIEMIRAGVGQTIRGIPTKQWKSVCD